MLVVLPLLYVFLFVTKVTADTCEENYPEIVQEYKAKCDDPETLFSERDDLVKEMICQIAEKERIPVPEGFFDMRNEIAGFRNGDKRLTIWLMILLLVDQGMFRLLTEVALEEVSKK